jgi:beta-galactosidase/beta-glucuronidase
MSITGSSVRRIRVAIVQLLQASTHAELKWDHPRPQRQRRGWIDLRGDWAFAFDDRDVGLYERWYLTDPVDPGPFDRQIRVPYAWQSRLSGIGEDANAVHDIVWYRRRLQTPPLSPRERLIVNFDAVDYEATVWVNGIVVGTHRGGQTAFSVDATDALRPDGNHVVVRARDYAFDPSLPRGKQDWREIPSGILYTRTTGIYGTVWAEVVDVLHVADMRLVPDVAGGALEVTVRLEGWEPGASVQAAATIDGREAGRVVLAPTPTASEAAGRIDLTAAPIAVWHPAPGRPALYDLALEVRDAGGVVRDRVLAYFGLRKVEAVDGRIRVNGEEVFLRGVLDQRWNRDGLMTAVDDDEYRHEVELALRCGFNFVRIHQRRESEKYYAWADRLGLMVSGEAANAFHFTSAYVGRMTDEWSQLVGGLFNHPSVILWLPLNESWGCRELRANERAPANRFQADHASAMYHLTKSLDPTRPCASNDGWEHTESDFTGVHDYSSVDALRAHVAELHQPGAIERLRTAHGRPVYVEGKPPGEAVIYTEIGGLFRGRSVTGIGYHTYDDDEDFYRRLTELVAVMTGAANVAGFVYTQWRDVESETNGLFADDGTGKWDLERIRAAITQPRPGSGIEQTDAG